METTESPVEQIARLDIPFTVINLTTTVAVLILPFFFHSTSAIVAFLTFYTVTGLGLTVGYHRLFAHGSFKVPKWLERTIAVCGYLAIQRGPIFWTAMHRLHHKYPDIPGRDPHTPKEGFWHVHFGWTHKRRRDVWDKEVYRRLTPDLNRDRFYLFLDREAVDYTTYALLQVASFTLGGFIGGGPGYFDTHNAICFLVWVGMLNRVAVLHAFGFINSVCHTVGTRPFFTYRTDESTNNFLVALLIFGEGWHNNHHAFPGSARQGLRWYQIDPSWYVILLLRSLGLASRVRQVPIEDQRARYRGDEAPQVAAEPWSRGEGQPADGWDRTLLGSRQVNDRQGES